MKTLIIGSLLPFLALGSARAIELSADSFTLTFSAEGRPESCRRKADGVELLAPGGGGKGFYLHPANGAIEPLPRLVFEPGGRLVASTADGGKKITFRVTGGPHELALRIEDVEGIDPGEFESLHFNAQGGGQLRALPLDYMTVVENVADGVTVD